MKNINLENIDFNILNSLKEEYRIRPTKNGEVIIIDLENKGKGFVFETKIGNKWYLTSSGQDIVTTIQSAIIKLHNSGYINLLTNK